MKITRYYKGLRTDGDGTDIVINEKILRAKKRRRIYIVELYKCENEIEANCGSIYINYDLVSFENQNENENT